MYRRALRFAAPYLRRLGIVLVVSIAATLVGLAQPYFLKLLIDGALLPGNPSLLIGISAGLFGISLVSFFLNTYSGYRYVQVSAEALFDMRLEVFRHLQRLSPRFYARMPAGDVLSRLNNDVSELQRAASDAFLSLITNAIFLAGTAVMLWVLEPRLFLLSIALLPFAVWILRRYRERVGDKSRRVRERSAEIGSFLVEALLGMRQTIASRQEEREASRFRQKNESFIGALLDLKLASYLASGLPGLLLSFTTFLVFVAGGYMVVSGSLTLGSFVAFTAYQARLLNPIQNLMGLFLGLQAARASLERVFALLDENPEVREPASPRRPQEFRGELALRSVSVSHGRQELVLEDISFRAPAGSVRAIVGPSGAGKSTLADLLLRRIDPDRGQILLDGIDLTELALSDLRAVVGVVEQETFLWNASIEENIRYGRPNARFEDIERAADAAALHDFVCRLPEGYRTRVGERGLQLSAGERQRIGIARVLLQEPRVLVLDEPSSALDGESEKSFLDALASLMCGRTTLILSHRLPVVARAEHVLVLERSRIVDEGTVEELLAKNGTFRRLFGSEAPVGSPA